MVPPQKLNDEMWYTDVVMRRVSHAKNVAGFIRTIFNGQAAVLVTDNQSVVGWHASWLACLEVIKGLIWMKPFGKSFHLHFQAVQM